jgi:hypothetical protein
MQKNHALTRAAHPLTFAAAALALINDLVLRPLWPAAWWTGKLSTFAAAFALPLLLTALIAACLPRRRKLAAGLGFGLVLLALFLLKASPQTNHWLTAWLPLRAVADPGDLLAVLPWLAALAFYFGPTSLPAPETRRIPIARLLLVPLAAFFLLADAAQPDYGAACLQEVDGALLTRSTRLTYRSSDGGRTWAEFSEAGMPDCYASPLDGPLELSAPDGTRYRVTPGQSVERFTAGAWEVVYSARAISEPERVYNLRAISSTLSFTPGPLDARIDPADSNLVVAMGQEGALIVPPAGPPVWAAVGPYAHETLRAAGLNGLLVVLGGEIWLAATLALAVLATAALRRRSSRWQLVLTILGWLLLAAAAVAQHPEINTAYLAAFASLGLLLACVWWLALALTALIRLRGPRLRSFASRIWVVPLAFVLVLLPYVVWGVELLPAYWLALAIAAVITAFSVLFLSRRGND